MSFRLASNLLRTPAVSGRAMFSSTARSEYARMTLLGRLTAAPEVRQTKNDKPYVKYTVATSDPPGPPDAEGNRAESASFHTIFAFGENQVERLTKLPKGTLVLAEADFKLTNEEGKTNVLTQHRSISVIMRPKNQPEASEDTTDHFQS